MGRHTGIFVNSLAGEPVTLHPLAASRKPNPFCICTRSAQMHGDTLWFVESDWASFYHVSGTGGAKSADSHLWILQR
jgi:hypothetical protein